MPSGSGRRLVVDIGGGSTELIIGEDPTRVEHLWQMMFRQHFWHGNGIVRATPRIGKWRRSHGSAMGHRFMPVITRLATGAGGFSHG